MESKPDNLAIAGAILAGGKASRLGGAPKGLPDFGREMSIIEHEIEKLNAAGISDLIIVSNDPQLCATLKREVIMDLRPGLGPLGGIEAALSFYSRRFHATLFLPCDLPYITAREITSLIRGFMETEANVVVAVSGEFNWEPLCAIVNNDLLPAISRAIDEGERKVREVWRDLGLALVHFPDPSPFFNLNTPGDLARWFAGREEAKRRGE